IILSILRNAISFRSAAKEASQWVNFIEGNSDAEVATPSHATGVRWMRRIGLFLLTRPLEKVIDMIAFVDTSISIGQSKCVIVLGIPRHKYTEVLKKRRALRFQDMQILDLVVVSNVTGEIVAEALKRSEARGGTIVQTCGDGGPEVVRGIKLFRSSLDV